jgi:hypothetical protein
MTYPTRDHEELLRRALHTAAESVEPAGDGLERIRARLSPPCPPGAASDIPAGTRLPEGIKMTAVSAGCALTNQHCAPRTARHPQDL